MARGGVFTSFLATFSLVITLFFSRIVEGLYVFLAKVKPSLWLVKRSWIVFTYDGIFVMEVKPSLWLVKHG